MAIAFPPICSMFGRRSCRRSAAGLVNAVADSLFRALHRDRRRVARAVNGSGTGAIGTRSSRCSWHPAVPGRLRSPRRSRMADAFGGLAAACRDAAHVAHASARVLACRSSARSPRGSDARAAGGLPVCRPLHERRSPAAGLSPSLHRRLRVGIIALLLVGLRSAVVTRGPFALTTPKAASRSRVVLRASARARSPRRRSADTRKPDNSRVG
jgi:hypothetical protein